MLDIRVHNELRGPAVERGIAGIRRSTFDLGEGSKTKAEMEHTSRNGVWDG